MRSNATSSPARWPGDTFTIGFRDRKVMDQPDRTYHNPRLPTCGQSDRSNYLDWATVSPRGLGADSIERSYFNRLVVNPDREFNDLQGMELRRVLPNLKATNLAVSGSTSLQHMRHIEERLSVRQNDLFGIVVMTTGGNDLIHNYGRTPPNEGAMYGATLEQAEPWIENFRLRLGEMFAEIDSKFPAGWEIYIVDIYDPTDGVGDAPSIMLEHWPDGLAIHAAYNQAIRDVAATRANVYVVPIHACFLGHGSHCRQFWREHYDASEPHYWYYMNVEDPNDRGYDAIRRLFLNAIIGNSSLHRKAKETVARLSSDPATAPGPQH